MVYNMKHFKKAQGTAASAAALIALIALLIILYVLFVPEEFREEMLNNGNLTYDFGNNYGSPQFTGNKYILDVSPGKLDYIKSNQKQYNLPALILYSKVKSVKLIEPRSVYVRNALFSREDDVIQFPLENPENVKNMILTFRVKKHRGRLVIKINDKIIFNDVISQFTINPIKVPTTFLKKNNIMTFMVSSPGIKFWSSNEYVLENVEIFSNIEDKYNLEGENSFVVPTEDLLNMKYGVLMFRTECNAYNNRKLDVYLNNNLLSSKIPVCGDTERLQFLPEILNTGQNFLKFKTNKGNYIIQAIKVVLFMKNEIHPVYYFELTADQIDALNSRYELRADFIFDDAGSKNLEMDVNGHPVQINADKRTYSLNIEPYVVEGTNSIKLIPKQKGIGVTNLKLQIK